MRVLAFFILLSACASQLPTSRSPSSHTAAVPKESPPQVSGPCPWGLDRDPILEYYARRLNIDIDIACDEERDGYNQAGGFTDAHAPVLRETLAWLRAHVADFKALPRPMKRLVITRSFSRDPDAREYRINVEVPDQLDHWMKELPLTMKQDQIYETSTKIGPRCCVCQTGEGPKNQIPFFQAGCQLWLTMQSGCDSKAMLPYEEMMGSAVRESVLPLPESCRLGTLKLGYVGHWGSSGQLEIFIDRVLLPTAKKYHVSVDYENTACSAMDRPEDIVRMLQKRAKEIPKMKTIRVLGNQATSVGLWDGVIPGRSNFYAIADSRTDCVAFPFCDEFEGRSCLGSVQRGERANCRTRTTRRNKMLQCCLRTVGPSKMMMPLPSYQRPSEAKVQTYIWSPDSECEGAANL